MNLQKEGDGKFLMLLSLTETLVVCAPNRMEDYEIQFGEGVSKQTSEKDSASGGLSPAKKVLVTRMHLKKHYSHKNMQERQKNYTFRKTNEMYNIETEMEAFRKLESNDEELNGVRSNL